ncbi:hypothetical protein [Gordonia jinghuaiqii]|uniref:hypothetical protein n=1 Tax=Gordonia jinghuaiqii TaxID=2758710 RepID=UPI001FD36EB1|nr:hypothetical protein [Gordonia jinghuaiqii]
MTTSRGEGSLVPPRVPSLWFPDVAPWPATDATPAADLAAHLGRSRSVSAAHGLSAGSAVAVLGRPAVPFQRPGPAAVRAVEPAVVRPSSDLDSFLAEAEQAVRAKRKAVSGNGAGWRTRLGPPRRIAGAAAAISVIVATLIGALALVGGGDPEPDAADTPATGSTTIPGAASTSSAAREPACTQRPEGSGGTGSKGNGTGDQRSGPGAIRAFNHAYYALRSARAARAVTTPGAVASEYVMQQYIDQRPMGTRHCLTIAERAPEEYSVVLTELQPDAAPITYRQVIRTTTSGDKTYIQSIRSVG